MSREELLQALKSGSDEVIPSTLVGAAVKVGVLNFCCFYCL